MKKLTLCVVMSARTAIQTVLDANKTRKDEDDKRMKDGKSQMQTRSQKDTVEIDRSIFAFLSKPSPS